MKKVTRIPKHQVSKKCDKKVGSLKIADLKFILDTFGGE